MVAEQLRLVGAKPRRSSWSRSAATPRRPSRSPRCRRWPRATIRCCWCCRPTTSSPTSRDSAQAVLAALPAAEAGGLVTFGIVPTAAETGYGYINAARRRGRARRPALRREARPGHREQYLASGEYFWNSGMFVFRASRYLEELAKYAAEHGRAGRQSLEKATVRCRFPAPGSRIVRRLSGRLDRLRGHGENRQRRHPADRRGLERCRLLVGAVVGGRTGRRRQCPSRRRDRAGLPQHPGDQRQTAGCADRPDRHRGGGHRRCRAGRAQGPGPGSEGDRGHAQEGPSGRRRPGIARSTGRGAATTASTAASASRSSASSSSRARR